MNSSLQIGAPARGSFLARRSLLRSALAFGAGAGVGGSAVWQALRREVPLVRLEASEPDPLPAAMAAHDAEMGGLMERAYLDMEAACGRLWGDRLVMPGRKVWPSYDAARRRRVVLDFDERELRAEAVVESEAEAEAEAALAGLRELVDEVLRGDEAQMLAHDMVMHRAHELAADMGVDMEEPDLRAPPGPMLKGVLPEDAARQVASGAVTAVPVTGADGRRRVMLQARIPFTANAYARLAERYAPHVLEHAGRHGVPASLILAVAQVESAFNPMAVSPASAYGLMQLVPRSGGLDAYRFLHGKARLLDPPVLFDPATNIKLGAAYLKLLDSRYLAAITDPTSRLYCAIAGYNTGAGNVARAFTGRTSVRGAAETINRLPPERVFEHLRLRLPFEETRRYLANVVAARDSYRAWDDAIASG